MFARAVRQTVFVVVSALIMVIASERIFWYYTDASVASFAELAAFYSLPVYCLFWFLHRFRVDDRWALLAAVPVFAYVVEGVITPIVYSAGPIPILAVWFAAWHGGLGVLAVWFGLRRLLVTGRTRGVLLLSAALGVFWGTWATTMWLPDFADDPTLDGGVPLVRSTVDFARYATISSAVLATGHWILGAGWWVRDYRPSRWVALLAATTCVVMVGIHSFAYPWAAPMFAVLIGSAGWMLRRNAGRATGPVIFEQLDGKIPLRALAMIAALPITASATYAFWMAVRPPLSAVRAFMIATIAGQAVVAAAAMVWAAKRLRGTGRGRCSSAAARTSELIVDASR